MIQGIGPIKIKFMHKKLKTPLWNHHCPNQIFMLRKKNNMRMNILISASKLRHKYAKSLYSHSMPLYFLLPIRIELSCTFPFVGSVTPNYAKQVANRSQVLSSDPECSDWFEIYFSIYLHTMRMNF